MGTLALVLEYEAPADQRASWTFEPTRSRRRYCLPLMSAIQATRQPGRMRLALRAFRVEINEHR
jgi:hypothetical protein